MNKTKTLDLLPFRVYNPDDHSQSVDLEATDWMEAAELGRRKLKVDEVGVTFTGPR